MIRAPRNVAVAIPFHLHLTVGRRWLLVASSIALITIAALRLQAGSSIELLYLFPILLAASTAEWQGGVAIAAAVTPLNLLLNEPITPQKMLTGTLVEIIVFWSVGFVCGVLVHERNRYLLAAHTDQLTGLGNRALWDRMLANEWERAKRFGQPFSIAICDLDHFKQVNDRYGHSIGDHVLKLWAATLQDEARTIDTICRIGGEEVAILLPHVGMYDASTACERWCKAVAALSTPAGPITMSVGIATYSPLLMLPELMSQADMALYAAKEAGRNQVVLTAGDLQLVY